MANVEILSKIKIFVATIQPPANMLHVENIANLTDLDPNLFSLHCKFQKLLQKGVVENI